MYDYHLCLGFCTYIYIERERVVMSMRRCEVKTVSSALNEPLFMLSREQLSPSFLFIFLLKTIKNTNPLHMLLSACVLRYSSVNVS